MRNRNNTHRRALPFLIIITFLFTIHSLVFSAVTMNQNAAEEEPGIVLNDPEESSLIGFHLGSPDDAEHNDSGMLRTVAVLIWR